MSAEDISTQIPPDILANRLPPEKIATIFNPLAQERALETGDLARKKKAEERYRTLLSIPADRALDLFELVPGESAMYRVQRGDSVEFFVLDEVNQLLEHDLQELTADLPESAFILSRTNRERCVSEAREDVLEVLAPYLTEPQKLLMLHNLGVYILPEEQFEIFKKNISPGRNLGGAFYNNSLTQFNPNIGGVRVFSFSGRRLIVCEEFSNTSGYAQPLLMEEVDLSKNLLTHVIGHEFIHALGVGTNLPPVLEEASVEYYAQMCSTQRATNAPAVGYALPVKYFTRLVEIANDGILGAENFHRAVIGRDPQDTREVINFFKRRYGEEISNRITSYNFSNSTEALEFLEYQEAMLQKRAS